MEHRPLLSTESKRLAVCHPWGSHGNLTCRSGYHSPLRMRKLRPGQVKRGTIIESKAIRSQRLPPDNQTPAAPPLPLSSRVGR